MGGCISTSSTQLDIRTVGDLRLLARELSRRPGIASRPRDGHGDTLLHLAALNGNPSSIRMLLEAGGEIDAADSLGRRPLHIAALSAHKACLLALLENGAAVNAQDGGGSTAAAAAAFQGNEACLRALLAAKASVTLSDRGGWTPLHVAARSGHEACLQALLDAGAELEPADAFGRRPLAVAAAGGKEACVRKLLHAGASVTAASSDGRTALHRAAGVGHEATVRALLEAGAAPGTTDASGSSALHMAAAFGSQPVLRCLVDAGADPGAADGEGRTAADIAEAAGHPEAARLLRQLQREREQELAQQQGQQQQQQQQEQQPAEQLSSAGAETAGQNQQASAEVQNATDGTALSSRGAAAVWRDAAAAAAEAAEGAQAADPTTAAAPSTPALVGLRSAARDDSARAAEPSGLFGDAGGEAQNGSSSSGSPGAEPTSTPTQAQPQRSNGSTANAEQLRTWELRFSDLTIERAIGQGSYGRVFLARLHETPCAVKLLLSWPEDGGGGGNGAFNSAANAAGGDAAANGGGGNGASAALAEEQRHTLTLSSPLLADLRREAGVMAALHHPNCVQLMGICADPAAIVTEYCPRGSLYDVLSAARRDPAAARHLTWARRLHLAMGAAQGMLHLHTRTPPVLHRDIKSPNILVDAAWRAKVCDLNLAKAAAGLSSHLSSAGALNPRWLAPEVLAGGGASLASDVFSFGVVLWELLTWRAPWSEVGGNPWQLAAGVISGKRPEVPAREELPGPDTAQFAGLDAYIALMQRCWAGDPAERPGFAEVVRQLRSLLSAATQAAAGSGSRAAAGGST